MSTTTTAVVCQFCAALDHIRATHTYTDPQGYVYALCERHYRPIREWRLREPRDGAALQKGKRA